ncbi:TPA: hypothetical protein QDZ42_002766 [Stenotrophomonas maltophilia]|nr:hypothetical protein [Stenotrophomonas maltophilia]HDS1044092.1 hypothetical protein [Stenotrophomonas maltophilia]
MTDSRRISMLDLDRHLSQSLEQARHAPLSVLRYGRPWVWVLSSDAWLDAARWAAVDSSSHPLLVLRRVLDSQLRPWAPPAMEVLPLDLADTRVVQRAAVLVLLRGIDNAQRLHDELRYHQACRHFIGFDHGTAWPLAQCARVLHACQHPVLRDCVDGLLDALPWSCVDAACAPPVRAARERSAQQRIAGGCLSY